MLSKGIRKKLPDGLIDGLVVQCIEDYQKEGSGDPLGDITEYESDYGGTPFRVGVCIRPVRQTIHFTLATEYPHNLFAHHLESGWTSHEQMAEIMGSA